MAGEVRFLRINTAAVREMLTNRNTSDVARFLDGFAERVKEEAIRLCPRRSDGQSNQFSSPLSATIFVRKIGSGDSAGYLVGSEDPRAYWVHEGTDPHRIPRSGTKRMRFYWKKAGRRVVFYKVSHPGISNNPGEGNKGTTRFLAQALETLTQRELGGSSGTIVSTGSEL